MMKRNVLLGIAILLLIVANLAAFYYTRPSVCILTDEIPMSYFKDVERPKHLTMDYRTTWRTTGNLERLSRYDMVIDMTLEGVEECDNVYRMEYDAADLFLPVLDTLADGNVYILYDESSPDEASFADLASSGYPNVELIPYDHEVDRSAYRIIESRIVEGSYLLVLNLERCMDLVRSLEGNVILVADYLDSAAIEGGADIVAAPDWDSIIRGFLSI